MKIKRSDIPILKLRLLREQNNRCSLCGVYMEIKDACLDHCHVTGNVRAVLCRNCNGIEGKVFNLANRAKRDATPLHWIHSLVDYWTKYINEPTGIYHPLHKTPDEKRELRNKRARETRKKKKV